MTENQYAPLTSAVVKLLTDKLYDKRKQAALDVEKCVVYFLFIFLLLVVFLNPVFFIFRQVRELYSANQTAQLEKLLTVLRELAMGANGHTRKGGLIGLAATAIALGKNSGPYTERLIEPVLACFNDPDLHVRYYACEVGLFPPP